MCWRDSIDASRKGNHERPNRNDSGGLRETVRIYFEKKVPRSAAELAFYLTLAIFPLLICISYISAG
jgi:uncharacterized BrkB/YihY/UPF0761 family membrane protein